MALGPKARDPNRPYMVYEFAINDRVFYTGIAPIQEKGALRATDRWSHVKRQLSRLSREGKLPLAKQRDLERTSNAVIHALIEAGFEENQMEIREAWRGTGRNNAISREKANIDRLLALGCKIANKAGNKNKCTVGEILRYLGVVSADV